MIKPEEKDQIIKSFISGNPSFYPQGPSIRCSFQNKYIGNTNQIDFLVAKKILSGVWIEDSDNKFNSAMGGFLQKDKRYPADPLLVITSIKEDLIPKVLLFKKELKEKYRIEKKVGQLELIYLKLINCSIEEIIQSSRSAFKRKSSLIEEIIQTTAFLESNSFLLSQEEMKNLMNLSLFLNAFMRCHYDDKSLAIVRSFL